MKKIILRDNYWEVVDGEKVKKVGEKEIVELLKTQNIPFSFREKTKEFIEVVEK